MSAIAYICSLFSDLDVINKLALCPSRQRRYCEFYPCRTFRGFSSRRSAMSRRSGGAMKDPAEGIRQVLGKHTKILLKTAVKLEKGGDKTDNRIIVITPHRLYVMTAKVPTKIDHHFHFLDISGIESKRPDQVVFRLVTDKSYSFRPAVEAGGSKVIDEIIITLAGAIRNIFPGVLLSHIIPKVGQEQKKRE